MMPEGVLRRKHFRLLDGVELKTEMEMMPAGVLRHADVELHRPVVLAENEDDARRGITTGFGGVIQPAIHFVPK